MKVPTVWDARYSTEAAPLTSTTKQIRVVALAEKEGLLDFKPTSKRSLSAIFDDIKGTHADDYVDAVRTGSPLRLAESQGFKWSPHFAEAVARIWHGHQYALALTAEHPLVLHPVSGAHHAYASRGGGFCTFNYLVGGARAHLTDGRTCAIIDLDAHHGDGTEALIEGDPRFSMFDISGHSAYSYDNDERVWTYEVPTAERYMSALKQLPRFLDTMTPSVVQYLAGADPYVKDPIGGIKGMTGGHLRQRDRYVIDEVLKRDIPMVVTLAGGYVPGMTEQIHLNTIREMAGALRLPKEAA